MADEIVSVGIKIETTGADKAAASLDKVVSAGGKVDAAADKITAGAGKASKSLESLGATAASVAPQLDKAGSSGGKLGDIFKQATDGAGAFSGSLGLVKAGLIGAAAAFSVQSAIELGKSFLRTADAITNLNSQLKLATGSAAAAKDAYEGLFAVAQRSRVGFVELGNTYAQIARATDGLGLSASNSLRIVETLGKAITISGVSAGSASAAMIQLSQGLSSGTLRGEELNSILEQTPRVARAIADGLGVSIGQLRTMGSEGRLTAEAVSGALLKASASIDKEFGSVATTVSQAMTVMGNATTKAVGDFDSIVGVSSAVATGILSIVDAAGQLKDAFSGSWTGQAVAALAAMRQKITDNRDNPTLDVLRVQLDNASKQATGDAGSGFGGEQRKASAQREVVRLQERIRKLETDEWDKAAQQISDSADKMILDYNRVKAAGDKFIEDKDNQTKAQQKESAFAKLRTEFAAATRDLREGSAEYLRVYTAFLTGKDNIAKKFDDKEKVDKSGASKAKADAEAYATAIAAGNKQVALLQATADARRPLTELEKLSIELREREEELVRKSGTSRLDEVKAINEKQKALVAQIAAQKSEQEVMASNFTAAIAIAEAREKTRDALITEAEAVEAQVRSLKDETAAIGVTGVALALLTNKRTDDLITALEVRKSDADSQGAVDAINRQIRALEALKQARLGNATAQVANDVAKENADAAKKSAEEWQKAYDQISQGLTDSLFRAAEAGKGFFATLRDSIKGMFNNLVLKPIIQYGVKAGIGALGGLIGAGANAAGIGGEGGGALGSLSSIASLISTGSSLNTAGGLAAGIGSYFTGAASTAAGVQGASALAIGAEAGALSGVGATTASSIYGVLSAIPVWGWVAMAGVAVAAIFGGKKGGPKTVGEAAVGGGSGPLMFGSEENPAIDTNGNLRRSLDSILLETNAIGAALGGTSFGGGIRLGFDQDPQGTAQSRIASRVYGSSGQITLDSVREVGRDSEQFVAEMSLELKRIMVASLKATDLSFGFNEFFAKIDPLTADSATLDNLMATAKVLIQVGENAKKLPGAMGALAISSAAAREKILSLVGGIDSLNQLQASYFQNFFSPDEQLAQMRINAGATFQAMGLSFEALLADPRGPIMAFRSLVEGLKDASGQIPLENAAASAALQRANPEVVAFVNKMNQIAEATRSAVDSIDKAFLSDTAYLEKAMRDLGFAVPQTAAEFEALTRAQSTSTDAGRQTIATLLGLKTTFDSLQAATKSVNTAISAAFDSDVERLRSGFAALNLEVPRTVAELEGLVRAQNTATESGVATANALLALKGPFEAVEAAAREAANAVIRQALETSRASVTTEMDALTRANGDLTQTLFDLENPIQTTADRFLELGQSMQDTIDRMGQILGTGAVSLLDQLQARVNTRTAIAGARVGLAGQIQDQQIQGFSNRRDFRGGISFLKSIENALFAELQTTTDPAGVAGQITQALTTRYQFEASLIQEADDLRRTSLEKEINRLESLIDIADRLRDTIVDLQTGSLSALAPQAQVSVAANSFNSVLNRAQAGDVKALQALPGEAQRFLTESQSFNASGGDYASVFSSVIDSLSAVGVSLSDAPTQLGLAQSQLTATGTVVDNTGAMVVDLRKLDTALEARSTRESDAITALTTAIREQIAADQREREAIAIERGLQANRWSGLATTLESIDTSMDTLANNATLEGAR